MYKSESNYEAFRVNLTRPLINLSGISRQIWDKFEEHRQTHDDFRRKLSTWKRVAEIAKNVFPGDHFLAIAGSALNGFGLRDSDLDLCLISRNTSTDRQKCLDQLGKLERFSRHPITFTQIVRANVPVLKFKDTSNGTSGDISWSNGDSVRNTYLLLAYSQIDWRVQPLAVVLKLWAKSHGIDSLHCSLSSYALNLMLIDFLQRGKAVLPNLQALLPNKFNRNSDVTSSEYLTKIHVPFTTQNRESLEELLRGFFLYYKNFDYKSVISIRDSSVISPLQYRNDESYKNACVFVEDPFHLENVARNVTDVAKIKAAAEEAYDKLQCGRGLYSIIG